MARTRTRDYFLKSLILGSVKGGAHRDNRKHASQNACRGEKITMLPATRIRIVRTFDWTRPALHGDELFEIGVDANGDIVAAALIDEDGLASPFNLLSFNEEEMASIKEIADGG